MASPPHTHRTSHLLRGLTVALVFGLAGDGAGAVAVHAAAHAYVDLASAATPHTPSEPTRRASVEGAGGSYRIEVLVPPDCRRAFRCEVVVAILPAEGWHALRDYPFKLAILRAAPSDRPLGAAASSGLTFEPSGHDVSFDDAGRARIRLPMEAAKAGEYLIDGRVSVGVCDRDVCRVGKHDLSFIVPIT